MNGAFAGKKGGPLLQGKEPDEFPEDSVVRKGNFLNNERYLARKVQRFEFDGPWASLTQERSHGL
jgi:hypothetical protein